MAYTNTFIQVAEDCPVTESEVPVPRGKSTPIHLIQYELLSEHPYQFNHEELIFAVTMRRQGLSEEEVKANKETLWADLFRKGHPCLRASALTKRYGWGAHYDEAGKIALYGMETSEYKQFIQNESGDTKLLRAMRSKRK